MPINQLFRIHGDRAMAAVGKNEDWNTGSTNRTEL